MRGNLAQQEIVIMAVVIPAVSVRQQSDAVMDNMTDELLNWRPGETANPMT